VYLSPKNLAASIGTMALRDAPTVISVPNSNVNLEYFGFPGVKAAAAEAGSTTTTLAFNAAAAAVDYFYVGAYVEMIDGAAAGEVVQVVDYDGASQTATVSPAFSAAPAGGDTYNVYGVSGVAQGAPRSDTIVLHASASATDQFYRGAYLYVQRGVGLGQVRYITAYDGASRTATVNVPWDYLPGPQTTYSIFGEGGTAQAAAAGAVTLDAAASATDGWYDGLCLEVLSAGNYAAVGQSARIDSYVGASRVATLEALFRIVPQAPVVYRVFGGWVGQYETTDGYATAACQVSTGDAEYGALEVAFSMTKTGLNNAGAQVYTREVSVWGQQLVGGVVGTTFHTHNLVSRCFRVAVHAFAHRVIGGCETRLSRHQFPLATHSVEKTLGILQECALTRAVLCGRTGGGGDYRNVNVGIGGGLAVDIPKSAFGDLRTVELSPQLQINFTNEVGGQEIVTFKAGAQSTIRHEVSQYLLQLGDSPIVPAVAIGDYAVLRTKKICRYRAGMGGLARFTTVFNEPTFNVWQFAGLATAGNALEFGYYDDTGVSKFGVNRARAGRHEIRTIEVTAAAGADGTVTLTLPNTLAAGGTTDFDVAVTNGDNPEVIAEKIVADAAPTWASAGWDVQNVGSRVIFRGVAVGARAAAAYVFADGGTGVTLGEVQRAQEGVLNAKPEIREINVRTGVTTTDTVTITLNGVANTVNLNNADHDTPVKAAWAVANDPATPWSTIGGGWRAEIVGSAGTRVRFTSIPQAVLGGAYSFAPATTGMTIDTYIQRQTGQAKQDNWVFQEDWNVDPCDGSGPSRFFLNPQKGNVYAVNLQYLGHGQIEFLIEDSGTGALHPVHRMQLTNSETATTLESPHMPFQASIYTVGAVDQTTYSLRLASVAYFTEGQIVHHAPRFAAENYVDSGNGSENVVLMLKHPEVYNDGPSLVGGFLQGLTCGIDASANDVTVIRIRLNPTVTSTIPNIEPNWELVSYPNSPMLLAKSTTIPTANPKDDIVRMQASGGELVFSRSGAGDTDWLIDMKNFELNRGDILTVSVYAYAGTLSLSAGIDWVEDH